MQKVSKQSLAMLALSILLAISIALTFTFAVLQDEKTATGTITFSGEASVAWTGGTADTEEGSIKFSLTNADFTFSVEEGQTVATLTNAATSFEDISVTFTNTSATALTWTIDTPKTDAQVEYKSGTSLTGSFAAGTGDESGNTVTKNLADILTGIKVLNADQADLEIEFIITASIGA